MGLKVFFLTPTLRARTLDRVREAIEAAAILEAGYVKFWPGQDEIAWMNVFARVGDQVITPPSGATALAGSPDSSAIPIATAEKTPAPAASSV